MTLPQLKGDNLVASARNCERLKNCVPETTQLATGTQGNHNKHPKNMKQLFIRKNWVSL